MVSVAATRAQRLVAAVISTRAILIENASAYVSSISTPLILIKIPLLFVIISLQSIKEIIGLYFQSFRHCHFLYFPDSSDTIEILFALYQ